MFFLYLLKSLKDKKYYIGQTKDLEKRLALHNSGKVASTKNRRPFRLIGHRTFESRKKARWFEFNLKRNTNLRKKFIKELVGS